MVAKALLLIDNERSDDAIALLESSAYWEEKTIYMDGLMDLENRKIHDYEYRARIALEKVDKMLAVRQRVIGIAFYSIIIFILVSVILLWAKYYLIVNMIVKPIVKLRDASRRVASGDLGQQMAARGNDEIGETIKAFNEMVDEIRASKAFKEDQLEELSRINANILEKDHELQMLNDELKALKYKLELKVDRGVEDLRETQKAVLNIMDDLQMSKEDVDKYNAELKKAYDELKSAQASLAQAEKMSALGRFSAGIAHEVKNPLAIILGGMEYLERRFSTADEDTKTAFSKIKEAVLRADKVLLGLLKFSRPAKLEREDMRVEDIVNEVAALFKYKAPLVNINIAIQYATPNIMVSVNKSQIQQVFFNVMANAIESMSLGGSLSVKVSLASKTPDSKAKEDLCVIEVSDTGSGISKEDMKNIFEPFFTTKRDSGGTGLGLPVAKSIVDSHGGDMTVESYEGKGTIVKIMLPIA
jgi:signal transduction histidine kinase